MFFFLLCFFFYVLCFFFFFFFFQAEDGIRDLTVTGVQTCALPICPQRPARRGALRQDDLDAHAVRRRSQPRRTHPERAVRVLAANPSYPWHGWATAGAGRTRAIARSGPASRSSRNPSTRHCERSEAIQSPAHDSGLLRCARNDGRESQDTDEHGARRPGAPETARAATLC